MTNELRKTIYNNLDTKETAELVEIWKTNDRFEWSDIAFEAVKEILLEREVDIPEQDDPVYQHEETKPGKDVDGFTEVENKILDDEKPPDFYDPFDVLKTSKQLNLVAKSLVIIAFIYNLINFSTPLGLVRSWFSRIQSYQDQNVILVYSIALLLMVVNWAIGCAFTYFSLVALSRILKIIMQMEYNSRK
jgi:hypothetical protein